ncbi:NADH-ubiquinone reductase complex 1 MLRQ subunit [Macleaya cordata]|uniref:NADH-ubiquinone reductase complex 1 MLRQ subunit n=1 Tax=Macleaya cordata TaxID=56857 RepID=A0A200RCM8_MACCD|nr:NADH-ubiquinone reductase complex 1 MLRQ subunit [Macleaya cordata]
MASSSFFRRWVRPEVYPLLVPMVTVVSLVGMQLVRNITTNPEVRVTKEKRAAGVLENFEEGERYSQHSVRKYVRNRRPEVMPSINKYFSDPK